jgi:hypothetical protein
MCHNPMRLWHTSQNDRSHGIVTHQFGTKFLKQVFGCLAFLDSYYITCLGVRFSWRKKCDYKFYISQNVYFPTKKSVLLWTKL